MTTPISEKRLGEMEDGGNSLIVGEGRNRVHADLKRDFLDLVAEVRRLTDSLKTTHLALVHFAAAAPWDLGDEIIRTVKAVEATLTPAKEPKP